PRGALGPVAVSPVLHARPVRARTVTIRILTDSPDLVAGGTVQHDDGRCIETAHDDAVGRRADRHHRTVDVGPVTPCRAGRGCGGGGLRGIAWCGRATGDEEQAGGAQSGDGRDAAAEQGVHTILIPTGPDTARGGASALSRT